MHAHDSHTVILGALLATLAGCTSGEDGGDPTGDAGPSPDGSTPVPRNCSDGVMNGDEADVDCGGSCPDACGEGLTCDVHADCASGFCHPESLQCEAPSCGDGFRNQDETDTDCGGACPDACGDGLECAQAGDCSSGYCSPGGMCSVPACDDALQNQDETDTDCGGSCGDTCEDGDACAGAGDCASGFCTPDTEVCASASCADGYTNQDETDTDCGGECGDTCADGETCADAGDCEHGFCTPDSAECATPSCTDAYLNQDETDVDCGGSCGASCEDGELCEDQDDCVTDFCHPTSSRCAPGECNNDVLDTGETDVDCGGVCGPSCIDGDACLAHADCGSGFCNPDTDVCATPDCADDFRNQDETDIDCGGECGATCAEGEDCADDGDCVDAFCNPTTDECVAPSCSDGFQNQDEIDEDCGGSCGAGSCDDGQTCNAHADCDNDFCRPDTDECATPTCGDGFQNQTETDVDCGNICNASCEYQQDCDSASGDCIAGLECTSGSCQYPCVGALSPMSDGSSAARQALMISEIKPGDYIELWNNTASAIALSSNNYQFCSRPTYVALSSVGAGITVPALGYATVPWPSAFSDTNNGGEIALYLSNADFSSAALMMDFVCWGSNPHQSRKSLAEAGGKWSGGCDSSPLTNGAIHRAPNTMGTTSAHYDTTLAPQPLNCTP